jgi:hypothetical protein
MGTSWGSLAVFGPSVRLREFSHLRAAFRPTTNLPVRRAGRQFGFTDDTPITVVELEAPGTTERAAPVGGGLRKFDPAPRVAAAVANVDLWGSFGGLYNTGSILFVCQGEEEFGGAADSPLRRPHSFLVLGGLGRGSLKLQRLAQRASWHADAAADLDGRNRERVLVNAVVGVVLR